MGTTTGKSGQHLPSQVSALKILLDGQTALSLYFAMHGDALPDFCMHIQTPITSTVCPQYEGIFIANSTCCTAGLQYHQASLSTLDRGKPYPSITGRLRPSYSATRSCRAQAPSFRRRAPSRAREGIPKLTILRNHIIPDPACT